MSFEIVASILDKWNRQGAAEKAKSRDAMNMMERHAIEEGVMESASGESHEPLIFHN